MPSYEYACARCGAFSATRPLAEWDQPAPCPSCGAAAPRALTAPAFATTGGARFAADAPAQSGAQSAAHTAGCSCCRPRAFAATPARG
jgi:putative FmdB family regulatory protein